MTDPTRQGLVIQHGANRTLVEVDGPDGQRQPGRDDAVWACSLRGKLRKGRQERVRPVVIGDRVTFTEAAEADRQGVIESVLPRTNKISRPAPSGGSRRSLEQVVLANVDCLWVIVSLAQPPLNLRFLDRILAAARFQGVDAGVILNKLDLPDRAEPEPIVELYRGLGYPVRCTSAEDGTGLAELRTDLTRGIHAFVGLSGVGKSSLLSALQPGLDLRVASVGEKSGHGRHTTTASRLYPLELGCYLADTPGMREFGLWGMFQADLANGFAEFESLEPCRFRDCVHRAEPGCAVSDAVRAGQVHPERYDSYQALLEELPLDALERDGVIKSPRKER